MKNKKLLTDIYSIKKQHQLTGHEAAIFALAPGFDVGTFLSAAGDGWIANWILEDPETGKLIARSERQIFSLLPLSDGRIVAGTLDGGMHWINPTQPEQTRDIAHHEKGVFALCAVQDKVYSIGGGGMLTRWDSLQERSVESLRLSNQSLRSIDYHPDRQELAIGASDNNIYLLDEPSLAIKETITNAHDNSVFCVRYHPVHPFLISGGRDAFLRVWDIRLQPKIHSAQAAHLATVNAIAFQADGSHFATASRDKTVKIWDASSFQLKKVLETIREGGHRNSVNCLLWLKEGPLISAGDDRTIIIWE